MKTARAITIAATLTLGLSAATIAVVENAAVATAPHQPVISAPMRTVLLPPIPAPAVTPVAAPVATATVAAAAVEAPTSGKVEPSQALPVTPVASASTAVSAPAAAPAPVAYCNVEAVTTQSWTDPNEPGTSAPAGTAGGGDMACSDVAAFESSFPPGTTFTVTQGDPVTQTTPPAEQREPLP